MRPTLILPLTLLCLGTMAACVQSEATQAPDNGNTPIAAPPKGTPAQTGNEVAQIPKPAEPAPQNGNLGAIPPVVAPPPVVQGPNVRIIGRADVADANGAIIAWPATQIVVGFTGANLTVDLRELDRATYDGVSVNNYFGVVVDNAAPSRIKLSRTATSYLVATGLPQGQHQVVLTKLTEAQLGRVQVLGVKTDGTLTFTSPVPARRLEFIGDSGTAGYGAGGTAPCNFSAATEDASVAYPSVTGTLLGADVHNLSFSGKGVVQNRDMQNDNEKTLPVLWRRTLPNDEGETRYVPNGWAPQAVVVTIGGNDFYAKLLDQTTFNRPLVAFIKEIQAQYAGVHVYLGVSPMLRNDSNPTQREAGIAYAQAAVASLADSRVHYLDLPPDLGVNGYGCDQHMSPGTHKAVANTVAQVLKAQLGW